VINVLFVNQDSGVSVLSRNAKSLLNIGVSRNGSEVRARSHHFRSIRFRKFNYMRNHFALGFVKFSFTFLATSNFNKVSGKLVLHALPNLSAQKAESGMQKNSDWAKRNRKESKKRESQ
jgi:hypothetical protein